jgi:alkanesulfonate monooxygenase SsuD/methylene tetrahydromethanopterin reductase-like flavin-dependent oxidoreductase (luciferase family)
MDFGYFTLSDNHYINNPRSANEFVAHILDEAVYADALGMRSAWIGEHHFSTLGVLSCPDLVLSNVAARTKKIRLSPAVTVLPLHHPIRVAEQWATLDLLSGGRVNFAAGRGYDRREYLPFRVSFENNQSIFEEGMDLFAAFGKRMIRSRTKVRTTSSRMSPSRRSQSSVRSLHTSHRSPSLQSSLQDVLAAVWLWPLLLRR